MNTFVIWIPVCLSGAAAVGSPGPSAGSGWLGPKPRARRHISKLWIPQKFMTCLKVSDEARVRPKQLFYLRLKLVGYKNPTIGFQK